MCHFAAIVLITQLTPGAWAVNAEGDAMLDCAYSWSLTDDKHTATLQPLLQGFYGNSTVDLKRVFLANGSCTCLKPVEYFVHILSALQAHPWPRVCLDPAWTLTKCPEGRKLFGLQPTRRHMTKLEGMKWLEHWPLNL